MGSVGKSGLELGLSLSFYYIYSKVMLGYMYVYVYAFVPYMRVCLGWKEKLNFQIDNRNRVRSEREEEQGRKCFISVFSPVKS